jgi:hypothetical protein
MGSDLAAKHLPYGVIDLSRCGMIVTAFVEGDVSGSRVLKQDAPGLVPVMGNRVEPISVAGFAVRPPYFFPVDDGDVAESVGDAVIVVQQLLLSDPHD